MEIICRIVEQHALQEHEYTSQQNTVQKFATMGFVLATGSCTFYCEMVQEQARKQGTLPQDRYYVANLRAATRPWTDQNGQQRWENKMTLTNISAL